MTFYIWKGNCLEGKDVEPGHMVELSRDILQRGRYIQMEKAIDLASQL